MVPGFFMGSVFLFLLLRSFIHGPRFGFRSRYHARNHGWYTRDYEPYAWGWEDPWRWDDPVVDGPRRPYRNETKPPPRSRSFEGFDPSSGGERLNMAIREFVASLRERLHATPAQERAFAIAVTKLRAATEDLNDKIDETRNHVAQALRGDSFDDSSFDSACQQVEEAALHIRAATREALGNVHTVLDRRQRSMLANLIESPQATKI
jgi:hypothetical protein